MSKLGEYLRSVGTIIVMTFAILIFGALIPFFWLWEKVETHYDKRALSAKSWAAKERQHEREQEKRMSDKNRDKEVAIWIIMMTLLAGLVSLFMRTGLWSLG